MWALRARALVAAQSRYVQPKRFALVNAYEHKTGEYPKTEEERKAAAKKYNVHPDLYETYSEDDQVGDYPKLPFMGAEQRDIHYPWDFPDERRNFNEPVHRFEEMINEGRVNYGMKNRIPMWKQWVMCLGTIFGLGVLIFISDQYKIFHPRTAKQYPNEGAHYTFDFVEK